MQDLLFSSCACEFAGGLSDDFAVPSKEFIGPMPVLSQIPTAVPLFENSVIAPPSPQFVGPMPAVIQRSVVAPVHLATVLAPNSVDFVGPMPAIAGSNRLPAAE